MRNTLLRGNITFCSNLFHFCQILSGREWSFSRHPIRGMAKRPMRAGIITLMVKSRKALLNAVLAFVFLAFGQTITLGTLIGSFSISYLFTIISPTPAGLGFVEGAMSLAMTTLRVPFAQAVLLTLAYRGITFWLNLVYGLFAIRLVNRPAPEIKE